MNRREFVAVIAGAAALRPLAGAAQPKMPVVGILVVQSPGSEQFSRQFPKEMSKLGYVDGQNIRLVFRSDQGDVSRLPELAKQLVGLDADVIVTWFTPAAHAAKNATGDIPIVMALVGNPVETGLVKSLARPAATSPASPGSARNWPAKRSN